MVLTEISSEEYGGIVGNKGTIFCSKDFLELNRNKVEAVRYFVGHDKKNRLALAVGEKNGEWRAPFSAPFATIVDLQGDCSVEYWWEFVELLLEKARESGISTISMLLAPDIYFCHENAKMINALLGKGFQLEYEEVNFSLNIKDIDAVAYVQMLDCKARNMLKRAMQSQLSLEKCCDLETKKAAYEIIKINHESKGYPVHMTWEQVLDTINIIPHDFFIVKKDGDSLAAAILFYTTQKIVQVIYWGNLPNTEEYKPMNFMAYELVKFYKDKGIEQIDIGPSSENGAPNFGLCNFKKSIGCVTTGKCRLSIPVSVQNFNIPNTVEGLGGV